ncbi:MAG: porin, partial [Candidatus Omnitrophota bacterium]|nr:porin [Candidatus Omnitrophota bacterium]
MKRVVLTATFFVAMLFLNSLAFADDIGDLKKQIQELRNDYEGKIQKLQAQVNALSSKQEEKIAKIEEEVEKKMLNVEYVGRYQGPFGKGGLLIKNPSGFGNVSIGGYADIEFENFQNSNSTFDQARFILNVGAQPHEKLLFYSEYEIEHGGINYPGGNGEAKIEQAWASYAINDWMTLKGGIVLVPFGKFNLLHDSDIQDLTERPLVSRRILGATWTDAGFGLLGELPVGETLGWKLLPDFYLNYEGYVVNGLDEDISDTGIRDARGSASNDLNNSKDFVARLGLGLNRN